MNATRFAIAPALFALVIAGSASAQLRPVGPPPKSPAVEMKYFRVTLKNIRWGLLYGIALSTARAIGEIGAVLIVSGQITGKTETATLIVLRFFDQYHDASGYIVALTLALVSILLLTGIEIFKRREERELQR